MPSPARLAGEAVLFLRRKGYSETGARQAVKDVIESLARETAYWEPWAVDWWRKLWVEANGTGTNARVTPGPLAQAKANEYAARMGRPQPYPPASGKESNGN